MAVTHSISNTSMTYLQVTVVKIVVVVVSGWLLRGSIFRWLANYTPRRVSLDSESDTHSEASRPTVSSWYGICRRTIQLEGWSGLFKGFVPMMLNAIIAQTFVYLISHSMPSSASNTVGRRLTQEFVFPVLQGLLGLPLLIFCTRAATTPFKLPWYRPALSLRLLLSKTELHQPWIVMLTPGLLGVHISFQLVSLIYSSAGIRIFKFYINSDAYSFYTHLLTSLKDPLMATTWVLVNLAYCALIVPLFIMQVRLMVQKNHRREYTFTDAEETVEPSMGVYASAEEDVIRLRDDDHSPYLGFTDCAKRIVNEEGWGTLYRAWILWTFFTFSGNAFWYYLQFR